MADEARQDGDGKSAFNLLYAPHFGMLNALSGNALTDQLRFAHDEGFRAWEDNGMMSRPVKAQESIASTMSDLGITMGVFVAAADFGRQTFVSDDQSMTDQLVAKMNGTPLPTEEPETTPQQSGKGGAPLQRAPEVPPQLAHAAARLLNPGPPPLRNPERWGASIALHILQEKSSITDWFAALNLSGYNNREARTIARALELGVSEFGAAYFGSKSAEVQLRRLLAIMVAAQSGSTAEAWRGASQLEDLPGDGIGANLPAVVQKSLRESLKLEYQLEGLLAGKMPDKKK